MAQDTNDSDGRGAIPFAAGRSGLLVILSGERLKAACAMRGWSLGELAARAKISRPTLANAVRGHPVRPRTAWKLARALRHGDSQRLDELVGAA